MKKGKPKGNGALTWTNERRKIGDLIEWERNPRQLTEKQAADLGESLRKFGYVEPVAVNVDGTILGGHMRRRILLAQALVDPGAEIDVRVPSRTLSQAEVAELNIRLNRNTGEWDFDKLANEFDQDALQTWGFEPWEFGQAPDPPKAFKTIDPKNMAGDLDQECPRCHLRFATVSNTVDGGGGGGS